MTSFAYDWHEPMETMNRFLASELAVLRESYARSGVSLDVVARIKPAAAVLTKHLARDKRNNAIANVADKTFVLPNIDYDARHPACPSSVVYNPFLDVVEASVAGLSQPGKLEVALIEALAANNSFLSPVILEPALTIPAVSAFYGPGSPRPLNSIDYRFLRRCKGSFGFFVKSARVATLGTHIGLAAKLAVQNTSDAVHELRALETIYNLTV